jgi:hypothetical protein
LSSGSMTFLISFKDLDIGANLTDFNSETLISEQNCDYAPKNTESNR